MRIGPVDFFTWPELEGYGWFDGCKRAKIAIQVGWGLYFLYQYYKIWGYYFNNTWLGFVMRMDSASGGTVVSNAIINPSFWLSQWQAYFWPQIVFPILVIEIGFALIVYVLKGFFNHS